MLVLIFGPRLAKWKQQQVQIGHGHAKRNSTALFLQLESTRYRLYFVWIGKREKHGNYTHTSLYVTWAQWADSPWLSSSTIYVFLSDIS